MTHFILNEEEVHQIITNIEGLIVHHYSDVKGIEDLRFKAAQIEATYVSYRDETYSKSAIFTFNNVVDKLKASIETIHAKIVDEEARPTDAELKTFYESSGFLVALLSSPHKYGFLDVDPDHTQANKYNEILSVEINKNLDTQVFNHLVELIKNCPDRMYKYTGSWHDKVRYLLTNISTYTNFCLIAQNSQLRLFLSRPEKFEHSMMSYLHRLMPR